MREPAFWWRSPGVASTLLAPFGALYGAVAASRMRRPGRRAGVPVICVGNFTLGGSGKTPTAIAIAELLLATGRKPVLLSRGYGGSLAGPVPVDPQRHAAAEVGDEALLLAAVAPTIVSRDRADGARLADALGATVIVMDDGFQNFQLAKDVSFVVVDAGAGFGNGRLIPAGPLREPIDQGLSRADAVVMLGDGDVPLPSFDGPIIDAELHPTAPERFAGRSVFAMPGIGRPEKFFATLRALGADLAAARSFPDHAPYAPQALSRLAAEARAAGAQLVTTEKDAARLPPAFRRKVLVLPVRLALDDWTPLDTALAHLTAA